MIQELVLVLDGRNGVVLAFNLFGASVFGSPPVDPKGFRNDHSRQPIEAAGEGLVYPKFGGFLGR